VCNFFARSVSILSPLIAELSPPMPLLTFTLSSIFALVVTIFLEAPKKN
jgi:hypothetical protein